MDSFRHLFKILTLTIISTVFIVSSVFAKTPENLNSEQFKTLIKGIHGLELAPAASKDCPDKASETIVLTTKESDKQSIPDILVSFIASEEKERPVQFYFYARAGLTLDGKPKYQQIKRTKTDVRYLDSLTRTTHGGMSIASMNAPTLDNFLRTKASLTPDEMEDVKIILEVIKEPNETKLLKRMQELTSGFNYDRKIQFLASIGANFSSGYDMARIDHSTQNSKGVVTLKNLFNAVKNSISTGNKVDAGVCRDMHLALAKMGSVMGIRNAYGLSYHTRSSGHLVMTATPNEYGQVTLINYGRVSTSKGISGTAALEFQENMPSWGTRLTISSGKTNNGLMYLPSQLGSALLRATGAPQEAGVYGDQSNPTGLRFGVKTPAGDIIFAKERFSNQSSDSVAGVFYKLDKSLLSSIFFNGAIGYAEAERKVGETNLYESGLYMRTSSVLAPEFRLSEGLKLRPRYGHHYSFFSNCRRTDSNPNCVEDDLTVDEEDRKRPRTITIHSDLGLGLSFQEGGFSGNLNYLIKLERHLKDTREHLSPKFTRVPQHQISGDISYEGNIWSAMAYGSLYLTDLQDQVVKTYKVGGEVTYRPLDLTLSGETSGRIDTAGRTAPAWLPGTDNTSRIRLIHRYPSIRGRFGMEYQSYDDFPQMNSGFLIYRIGK